MTKPSVLTKFDVLDERLEFCNIEVFNPEPDGQGSVNLLIDFALIKNEEDGSKWKVEAEETFVIRASADLIALNITKETAETEDINNPKHHVLRLETEMNFVFIARESIEEDEISDDFWLFETLLRPIIVSHIRKHLSSTPLLDIPPFVYLQEHSKR